MAGRRGVRFHVSLKFKIVGNNDDGWANSGIQYRARVLDKAKFSVGGYQADFEAGTKYSGILYEEKGGVFSPCVARRWKFIPSRKAKRNLKSK